MSFIKRKEKTVTNANGVTYVRNKYTDAEREYSRTDAVKREEILKQYTIEDQLNAMRRAIITIADKNGVEIPELKAIETLVESL